ncbi:MAG TPA: (2Fe-2S)-binding protein [Candidatus Limnocylindrales bacterium]
MSAVSFTVNGAATELDVPGMRRLLDVLREDLGLTGTKEGCGEGECGACSVLVDGVLVDSCLVPVCQVDGTAVRTVEGLAPARAGLPSEGARLPSEGPAVTRRTTRRTGAAPTPADLDTLQAAFLETGGAQCGICTPGMLMAGHAFLASGDAPTEEAIRDAIAGNLCRCTGYVKIVEAIALAAERRASETGV